MVTETQKRIEAYRELLPGLREKVVAVAFLLALSVIMLTSASFAWLTISRAPEVTAVSTNIAANGSLEIALATGDGRTAPGESQEGDSIAADGQTIDKANKTWGNLINLGDPLYGLDHLTLRPARLNEQDLLGSPFYGAVYDGDGRITQLKSDFGYTLWQPPTDRIEGKFILTEEFGVRAISSIEKTPSDVAEIEYVDRVDAAKGANVIAQETYENLKNGTSKTNISKTYMNALGTVMGKYLTAELKSGEDPDLDIADIEALRDLYGDFIGAFEEAAKSVSELVNFQMFAKFGTDFNEEESGYTVEDVYNLKAFPDKDIKITGLKQFVADWKTIEGDYELLDNICDPKTEGAAKPSTVKYSEIEVIVSNLVNVGTCKVDGQTVNYWSSNKKEAIGLVLNGGSKHRAIITNGILFRFEQFTGARLIVDEIIIPVTYLASLNLSSSVETSAAQNYFSADLDYAENKLYTGAKDFDEVAKDTYGLAVDFWVRTNAKDSYLILEGNVITESEMVPAMTKDSDGNEVPLYTYTISGTLEDGSMYMDTFDVYQKADGTWYNDITHTPAEIPEGVNPTGKMVEKVTVLGYEGENRVWDSNKVLSTDVTTQGGGSCYVYYADTPEDTERSLVLLQSFVVAFVDGEGNLLCTAYMDTERYFAENGRIIVPLKLSPNDSTNIGKDDNFNDIYAITRLEEDVPTRITALVYLDGSELTNDEVLAAADIQGQLNIQFGSSGLLKPIEDEELQNQEVSVTASVDPASFEFDKATESDPMTSNVTVKVSGFDPKTVKAFFIRQINATQGSREAEMEFTKNADGTWTASHTFAAPGNYILRTVKLDGQEYRLNQEVLPTVEIKGFSVSNLTITKTDGELSEDNKHVKVLTANSSSYIDLSLELGGSEKIPDKVQGRFIRDDGTAVNVDFTYNPTNDIWTGRANFIVSGDYMLQYLLFDGQYEELPEGLRKTADISLGMRVHISTTSPTTIKYIPSQLKPYEEKFQMRVRIVDDTGEGKGGFSNVTLVYGKRGSTDTIDGDLTWDGEYYTGEIPNGGPAIWEFRYVQIGERNTITTAATTVSFTVRPPEPPEYISHDTDPYQYTASKNAVMKARISYSGAADGCEAYIVKSGETEGTWVEGDRKEISGDSINMDWNFKVPGDKNNNDYQDGKWQLTALRLWGVYDESGKEYTKTDPLVFDVSDTNNVTKVVNRITVSFDSSADITFGKSGDKITGDFMAPCNVTGMKVKIHDFEGPVDLSNVKVVLTYNGESEQYGGYTTTQGLQAGESFEIDLSKDPNDPEIYTQPQTAPLELRQAGKYSATVKFNFKPEDSDDRITMSNSANSNVELLGSAPKVYIYSKTPTVKITARTNYGSSSNTDTSATVYFNSSRDTTCGITSTNYQQPYVTITLAGLGNATEAKLTFAVASGDVHLYPNNNDTASRKTTDYLWSTDGTCQRWVGYYQQATGDDRHTPAGTLTADVLVLTYEGKQYTVNVSKMYPGVTAITINNPS